MMNYTLEYTPDNYYRKERLRKTMLALSIVLDFVAIALVISAIFDAMFWIGVVAIALVSNGIRYVVNMYPKKYTYGISSDIFYINEVTPLRNTNLINTDISNILNINEIDDIDNKTSFGDNITLLCDNSCQLKAYMLEFNDKSYVLPLDEYMYTLLKSKSKIEDK